MDVGANGGVEEDPGRDWDGMEEVAMEEVLGMVKGDEGGECGTNSRVLEGGEEAGEEGEERRERNRSFGEGWEMGLAEEIQCQGMAGIWEGGEDSRDDRWR